MAVQKGGFSQVNYLLATERAAMPVRCQTDDVQKLQLKVVHAHFGKGVWLLKHAEPLVYTLFRMQDLWCQTGACHTWQPLGLYQCRCKTCSGAYEQEVCFILPHL